MAHLNYYYPVYDSLANLLDEFLSQDTETLNNISTLPAVNVLEREKDYVIEMAAPGMKKENFEIEIDNDQLIIEGKVNGDNIEEKANYTKREFAYNNFKRVFTLPETIDGQNISAQYKDGILSITLAKKPEAQVQDKKMIKVK